VSQATEVKVRGVEQLLKRLAVISVKTPKKVENGMYRLTSLAAEMTRQSFPGWIWDTGRLAGSVDNTVKWYRGQIEGYVFTMVDYGIYVHFGTFKMRARPFMNIAMNVLRDPIRHKWAFGKILE